MIHHLVVTNHQGESLKMVLSKPEESGMVVMKVDGLGPVKANVNVTDSATTDGGTFNGSRLQSRNIVLTLDFRMGDPEHQRHQTYKYFPIKKQITLDIYTDERVLRAFGVVEANEPDIFSEFESAQISIMCADPFLYSIDGQSETVFSGIVPMFEFPFCNNSTRDKLIQFGEIVHKQENTVFYTGDIDVGVTITIHAMQTPIDDLAIYNSRTREVMRIDTEAIKKITGEGFHTGDDIIICTARGRKSCRLLRAGNYYNILNAVKRGSDWFQITKGDNIFAYNARTNAAYCQFKIANDVLYGGI